MMRDFAAGRQKGEQTKMLKTKEQVKNASRRVRLRAVALRLADRSPARLPERH